MTRPRVAVLTGSQSDVPVLEPCLQTLSDLGIEHELHVMSAHRTPAKVQRFALSAADYRMLVPRIRKWIESELKEVSSRE